MDLLNLHPLPQDIINHIAEFYITTQIKLQCRIDKIYKKVEEMEKRTIDEWIEHVNFSKRYSIKHIEIIGDRIHFLNLWGDQCKCNKNDIINQGCIMHVRRLYRWYTERIISASTPTPRYEGEKFINIIGENMIAKVEYRGDYTRSGGDEDDECSENYIDRYLVFTQDKI